MRKRGRAALDQGLLPVIVPERDGAHIVVAEAVAEDEPAPDRLDGEHLREGNEVFARRYGTGSIDEAHPLAPPKARQARKMLRLQRILRDAASAWHPGLMRQPSRTARMVAAYRARATERPTPVCNDPFARPLAGPGGFEDAARYDEGAPYIELFVALRTAFFDRAAKCLLERGFSQVVVLGAGLDTRAARLGCKGVRFFEVDHPTTQADKLARLAALPGYPLENATYVPCDFSTNDFVDRLDTSGFRADLPALLLWEGVTYYLTEDAVRATLRSVAERLDPRSVILFDHVGKRMGSGAVRESSSVAAWKGVAEMGEPLLFGTDHALPMLYEVGFRKARVMSFDEIALNLTGTYDRARTFRFQHVVLTSVAEPLPS